MRSTLLTLSFLAALGFAAVAQADAPVSAKHMVHHETPELGRWSFGAGIGTVLYGSDFGYVGGAGAAGLAALGGNGGTYGTVLIERSLSPALRLGANLTGSYADTERKGDEVPGSPSPERSTYGSAGGAISLRWVLNPGDLVEISPLVIVGTQWFKGDGTRTSTSFDAQGEIVSRTETDVDGYRINARFGFVVEYRLLTRMYLRLETHVLRVDRTSTNEKTRTESEGNPVARGSQTSTAVSAGVGVQPMLQIRVLL